MIRFSSLIIALSFASFLLSCNSTNDLDTEGYMFYQLNEYGSQIQVPGANFQKGQTILLYLFNIGPFTANRDMQYQLNMDVEIIHGKKKRVFLKKNYLGKEHITYEKDTIPFLYAVWQASSEDKVGEYTFRLCIKDKVSGNKSIFEPKFSIGE
ncbi:MAG: hypothetical protein ISR55_09900 [Bacteroidetes bacterium]|nr:hypothetical protein [Bacteroidota bacterium]